MPFTINGFGFAVPLNCCWLPFVVDCGPCRLCIFGVSSVDCDGVWLLGLLVGDVSRDG